MVIDFWPTYPLPIFQKYRNGPKIGAQGFWSLLNTNLATKNFYDVELRVYRSIFRKKLTLPVELEISYFGFFWCHEHEKIYENITRSITEGLHADFQIFKCWSLTLKLGIQEFFNVRITTLVIKIIWCIAEGLHVDFQEENPNIPNFKVDGWNLYISENWHVDPQLYIVWCFSSFFSCSWHQKTPK